MDATKKRAEKLQAKGKPVDFKELLRMEPDGGTTNIRNVGSKHWTRWLGTENRCVVPFNSEFNKGEGGDIWFALDESRPSPASPASGPTGRRSERSRKARLPTTSTHSHDGAELGGGRRTSEGDAGDPDDARRGRDLDDRVSE